MKEKRETYEAGLFALVGKPLIGSHTIGELTIEFTHRTWSVFDANGNRWSGRATTGHGLREGASKAVRKWLKLNPH